MSTALPTTLSNPSSIDHYCGIPHALLLASPFVLSCFTHLSELLHNCWKWIVFPLLKHIGWILPQFVTLSTVWTFRHVLQFLLSEPPHTLFSIGVSCALIMLNSFVSCIAASINVCDVLAPTLFVQASICSFPTFLGFLIVVSCLIIADVIAFSVICRLSSLPFLDTLVSQTPSNTLTISVYRKPTHTNQFIHWDSNHNCPAKYSIYNTLAHRARVVCKNQQTLKKEEAHIRQALLRCSYPPWVLNRLHTKINHRFNPNQVQMADNTIATKMQGQKTFFQWCLTPGGSVRVSRKHVVK